MGAASYYAHGPAQFIPDALLDHFGDLRFRFGDAASISTALREQGYTHILLNCSGLNYYLTTKYDPITSADVAALQQLLARDFRQVYGRNGVELAANGTIAVADSDAYELYEVVNAGEGK